MSWVNNETDTATGEDFSRPGGGKFAQSGQAIVASIRKQIDDNYSAEYKLKDLAKKHFVNPNYLSSLFYKQTTQTFTEYLCGIRIEKAKQFLKYTDLTTSAISDLVGYTERGYFSKSFKKKTGVSPSQYRRESGIDANQTDRLFVYAAVFKNDPMIIEQDLLGLKLFSKEYHIRTMIEAPEKFNEESVIKILKRNIKRRPEGLMVCASSPRYTPYINEAVKAGIPTITVDCDAPDSLRLAHVGSNWIEVGARLSKGLSKAIGYGGQVAVLNMSDSVNMQEGYRGFCAAMAYYPDIEVIGQFNDRSDKTIAEQITMQLLSSYPNLRGIAGLDSNSAIGACAAIRKMNMTGKIKVISIDISRDLVDLLKQGQISLLVSQKRALFSYYGGKILYDYLYGKLDVTTQIQRRSITSIPSYIDTGLFELSPGNLDIVEDQTAASRMIQD